jgi:hypothetical protein
MFAFGDPQNACADTTPLVARAPRQLLAVLAAAVALTAGVRFACWHSAADGCVRTCVVSHAQQPGEVSHPSPHAGLAVPRSSRRSRARRRAASSCCAASAAGGCVVAAAACCQHWLRCTQKGFAQAAPAAHTLCAHRWHPRC